MGLSWHLPLNASPFLGTSSLWVGWIYAGLHLPKYFDHLLLQLGWIIHNKSSYFMRMCKLLTSALAEGVCQITN